MFKTVIIVTAISISLFFPDRTALLFLGRIFSGHADFAISAVDMFNLASLSRRRVGPERVLES